MAVRILLKPEGWSFQALDATGDGPSVGSTHGTIDSITFTHTDVAGELKVETSASTVQGE